jgi:multidrug resistance efflux pump
LKNFIASHQDKLKTIRTLWNRKSVRASALAAAAAVVALSFFSCIGPKPSILEAPVEYGPAEKVGRGNILKEVGTGGIIGARNSLSVYVPKVSRYWEFNISWTQAEGSTVKKDDPIVKLDDSAVQKDLQLAKMKLEAAQLKYQEEKIRAQDEVENAAAEIELSRLEWEKQKLLVPKGESVSENEIKKQMIQVQTARSTHDRSKKRLGMVRDEVARRLQAVELDLQNSQNDVNDLTTILGNMVIKAPKDGLLVFPYFYSEAGPVKARQGLKVHINTVVAEIHDLSDLVVKSYIPEIDIDGIRVGTKGVVQLGFMPQQKFAGVVEQIARIPSTPAERKGRATGGSADQIRQFEVMIKVDKLPTEVVPGMTAIVNLEVVNLADVIRVPLAALSLKPLSDQTDNTLASTVAPGLSGTQAYIYAQRKGQHGFKWQKVLLGQFSYGHVEIKDGLGEEDLYRSPL